LYIPPVWLDPAVFLANLAWALARSFVTFAICFIIGLAGLKILDMLTPGIRELKNIKGHPLPTALLAAGMFIFLSLSFVGSVIAPLPVGVSTGLGASVSPLQIFGFRMIVILAGFAISIIFSALFYRVLGRLEPFGIDLHDVNRDPVATGVYIMGYEIFLGVIIYACLLLPV
jgi:uncharacterized membrane protein YjfL (UPF0719 family)